MASKSGMFLDEDERQRLKQTLEYEFSSNANASGHNTDADIEGCLVCGQDDDHNNLMLCEGCNSEYHTYCLDPPLSSVPHDDWYCDRCVSKSKRHHKSSNNKQPKDDGLASLVTALPREFTSRFGEVCWAYGGFGFGWWPACIFDPRLTTHAVRQTARKQVGKKHLIYFFECHETPFAFLSAGKIALWHEGLAGNYHLGKTARAAGKHRSLQFQQALQAAMVEDDKPLDMRLDWNRSESEEPQLLPIPHRPSAGNANQSASATAPEPVSVHLSPVGRKKKKRRLEQPPTKSKKKPLFCRIVKKAVNLSDTSTGSNENNKDDVNIGFVKLKSAKKATFAGVRQAMATQLGPEAALAPGGNWKFHVTTLGPVSTVQETSLGPVLPFLRSGIGGNVTNGGSIDDPITVIIFDKNGNESKKATSPPPNTTTKQTSSTTATTTENQAEATSDQKEKETDK